MYFAHIYVNIFAVTVNKDKLYVVHHNSVTASHCHVNTTD